MGKSLLSYVKDRRDSECQVCKLAQEVRQQVDDGLRSGEVSARTIGAWLHAEVDGKVSDRGWDHRVRKHQEECLR